MRPAALLVCEGIVDEKTLDFVIGIKADDFRGVEFECEEEGKQTEGISFAVEEVPAYITLPKRLSAAANQNCVAKLRPL